MTARRALLIIALALTSAMATACVQAPVAAPHSAPPDTPRAAAPGASSDPTPSAQDDRAELAESTYLEFNDRLNAMLQSLDDDPSQLADLATPALIDSVVAYVQELRAEGTTVRGDLVVSGFTVIGEDGPGVTLAIACHDPSAQVFSTQDGQHISIQTSPVPVSLQIVLFWQDATQSFLVDGRNSPPPGTPSACA